MEKSRQEELYVGDCISRIVNNVKTKKSGRHPGYNYEGEIVPLVGTLTFRILNLTICQII